MTTDNTQLLSNETIDMHKMERGASLVEYALLVALIAIISITAVGKLGTTVSDQFSHIQDAIDGKDT